MQAILTRYFGPTNTRGSYIKASCEAKTIKVPWDHALNVDDNHRAAAEKLRDMLGWVEAYYGDMVGGGLPKPVDSGYAFVFTGKRVAV